MEKFILNCKKRRTKGSSRVRKLRKEGLIPGVIYGEDFNELIIFRKDEFIRIAHRHPLLENIIIELNIEDNGRKRNYPALVKEVQRHFVSDEIIHIDFKKISLKEKIKIRVPLVPKGEAPGLKAGGILEQMLREIEIECLPEDIPEKIEVDISGLNVGDVIHVSSLRLGEKFRILSEPQDAIFTCLLPKVEEVEERVEEEIEEPEVIKKKEAKEEEEAK